MANAVGSKASSGDGVDVQEQRSGYRYWVLVLAFLGIMVTFIDRVNLSVAAPLITKQMHMSHAEMGVVLSTFFWSYTILQIPSGYLIDRLGIRKTFTGMFWFWGIFSALTAAAGTPFGLGLVRGGLGVAESPMYPGLIPFLKRWFHERERALMMGIIGMGLPVGSFVGAALSGALIAAYGWRLMFIVTGILSALVGILWWVTYRDKQKAGNPKAPSTPFSGGMRRLLQERNVWALTIGYFGSNYSLYLFLTWLPTYFVLHFHFSILKSGIFTGLVFLAGLVGKPFVGWISGRILAKGYSLTAARKWVLVPTAVLGTSMVLAAIIHNAVLAAIFLAIAEAFSTAGGSMCWATGADIAPLNAAGQVGGIMNTAAGLGGIVAPIVTGILLTMTHSFMGPLLVAAVIQVGAGLSYGLLLGRVQTITA